GDRPHLVKVGTSDRVGLRGSCAGRRLWFGTRSAYRHHPRLDRRHDRPSEPRLVAECRARTAVQHRGVVFTPLAAEALGGPTPLRTPGACPCAGSPERDITLCAESWVPSQTRRSISCCTPDCC